MECRRYGLDPRAACWRQRIKKAEKNLIVTDECVFDLEKNGARLRPVSYGSRSCTDMEKKFNYFVGESAASRWVIIKNWHYLWGTHFYWMLECKSVQEVLEYIGSIAMVKIWAQELLGYHFTVIHWSEKMMRYVNALTWRSGENFSVYLCVANILCDKDEFKRPYSYYDAAFVTKGPTRLKTCNDNIFVPVITVQRIWNISQPANIAPTDPPSKITI